MARIGLCGICGTGAKLTDEHIPPQCAGNQRGIELFSGADWMDAGGVAEDMKNGQPRPEGTLWATLCRTCNVDVLGSWYVPHFCDFQNRAKATLRRDFAPREAELRAIPNGVATLYVERARPLPIVKTIVGMILALNAGDDPEFRVRHPGLVEFVLDKEAPLPPPYRAYLALHFGPYAAFAPTMFKRSPGEKISFSAIDYPPFACVVTFDEQAPDSRPFLPCGGLAEFARMPHGAVADVEIGLLMGFRDSPVPGDYGQPESYY